MLDQLYLLHELYPIPAATIDLVFGLLIGSFLNVVITRLPLMLEQQWQQEAQFLLELEPAKPATAPLSLSRPRGQKIKLFMSTTQFFARFTNWSLVRRGKIFVGRSRGLHGFSWKIHGKSMGNPWKIHGKSMENPWKIDPWKIDFPKIMNFKDSTIR